ncbi:MAG TPA: HD domain-containing protein [Rhodocyclaceae bacterium]|nr:HD domain-containing protein [Rhodocyclaceae bacterium]
MNRLIQALAFAATKHRDQRRKDAAASPYINHPIALANVLANEAGIDDERVLIAAILHDTVEDTETTDQELAREFGQEVAGIVLEVSDDKPCRWPSANVCRLNMRRRSAGAPSWSNSPTRSAICAMSRITRRPVGR